ncbi:MAG: PorT family protein [Bacteroidales bacterium]|jgi:hypothetical protein|nr:PorT family protein [Bacteroidales bacterium]
MKKSLTIVLSLLLAFCVYGQDKKISGGLYLGTGLSWCSSDTKAVTRDGAKMNYGVGLTMDYNFVDNFGLSLSFGYQNLGSKLKYQYGAGEVLFNKAEIDRLIYVDSSSAVKYSLNCLELPIGLKGKTNEIEIGMIPFTFFLKAEVVPALVLSAKGNYLKGIGTQSEFLEPRAYENELITKDIKRFQLGWRVGGGMEMGLSGTTRLLVELYFNGGILDVDKTKCFTSKAEYVSSIGSLEQPSTNPIIRISNVGLKVGVLF